MKNSYLTLALLLILFNFELNGQYFGSQGAKWSYEVVSNSNPDTLIIIESIGKQEILGVNCNVLQKSNIFGCDITVDEINYTYFENGKVFWYNEDLNDFTTLYDFNAEAGDSWVVQIEDCSILVEIDSVAFEAFNGELLKVLYPQGSSAFGNSRIIEKLGREQFLFPSLLSQDCGVLCEGPQIMGGLRCYDDSLFNYQSINYEELCFQTPPPTQDTCNFLTDIGPDLDIYIGDNVELELVVSISLSDIENVLWTPNETLSCNDCFNPIATPTENTCYIAMVTDVFNCTLSDSVCFTVHTTSIDDLGQIEKIKLFPNPANDIVTVTSDEKNISEIKIYDIIGHLIMKVPSQNLYLQNINISELDVGVYFIEAYVGDHFFRKKFVKK